MPETILIVDYEPAHLHLVEYALRQKLHYRVISVGNHEEAMQWVHPGRQPQPDLMLIEGSIAQAEGCRVIRTVKAYRPQLPVIVMAPYGSEELAAQAVAAGARDFVTRPVTLERLKLS